MLLMFKNISKNIKPYKFSYAKNLHTDGIWTLVSAPLAISYHSSARPLIIFKTKTKNNLDLKIQDRPKLIPSLEFQDQESCSTLYLNGIR